MQIYFENHAYFLRAGVMRHNKGNTFLLRFVYSGKPREFKFTHFFSYYLFTMARSFREVRSHLRKVFLKGLMLLQKLGKYNNSRIYTNKSK